MEYYEIPCLQVRMMQKALATYQQIELHTIDALTPKWESESLAQSTTSYTQTLLLLCLSLLSLLIMLKRLLIP